MTKRVAVRQTESQLNLCHLPSEILTEILLWAHGRVFHTNHHFRAVLDWFTVSRYFHDVLLGQYRRRIEELPPGLMQTPAFDRLGDFPGMRRVCLQPQYARIKQCDPDDGHTRRDYRHFFKTHGQLSTVEVDDDFGCVLASARWAFRFFGALSKCRHLTELTLRHSDWLHNDTLLILTQLRSLRLQESRSCPALHTLTGLTSLEISRGGGGLYNGWEDTLQPPELFARHMPNLKRLHLDTYQMVADLHLLTALEDLNIDEPGETCSEALSDACVTHHLTRLTSLKLSSRTALTDTGLRCATSLTHLDISHCDDRFTLCGIETLTRLQNLILFGKGGTPSYISAKALLPRCYIEEYW